MHKVLRNILCLLLKPAKNSQYFQILHNIKIMLHQYFYSTCLPHSPLFNNTTFLQPLYMYAIHNVAVTTVTSANTLGISDWYVVNWQLKPCCQASVTSYCSTVKWLSLYPSLKPNLFCTVFLHNLCRMDKWQSQL